MWEGMKSNISVKSCCLLSQAEGNRLCELCHDLASNLMSNILWWRSRSRPWNLSMETNQALLHSPSPGTHGASHFQLLIFPLALLQFSSWWGRSEEVLFPQEKARWTSASPSLRRESEGRSTTSTFPSCLASSHSLMGSQGQGHSQSAPKHLQQREFTPASLIHISPLPESLRRDRNLDGLPS